MTYATRAELEDRYTDLRFSAYGNAFLADAIVMQRYMELNGQFRKLISVVKVRASEHSKDLRFYDFHDGEMRIEATAVPYSNVLSGRVDPGLELPVG